MRRQSGTIIRDWMFEVRLEQKLDSATNRECCYSPNSGCRFRWRVLGSQRHCVFQQFGSLEFEANERGRPKDMWKKMSATFHESNILKSGGTGG
jgi:hypothetical protein